MISKTKVDLDKEILKRIQECKKEHDKKMQRTELIQRNKMFLTELNGLKKRLGPQFFKVSGSSDKKNLEVSDDHPLLKLDYPKLKFFFPEKRKDSKKHFKIWEARCSGRHVEFHRLEDSSEGEKDPFFRRGNPNNIYMTPEDKIPLGINKILEHKITVLETYEEYWEFFCERWGIYQDWNGKLSRLSKDLRTLIEIWVWDYKEQMPIAIYIGPWTTLDDVRNEWKEIEKIQKKISYKIGKSVTFSRDLCWYDLRKKYKLSYGKIAKFWIDHFPENIELMAIKRIIKDDKSLKGVDAQELLMEIKTGDPSIEELIKKFNETNELYRKPYYSPLIEIIKKSIKRMESKIERLNVSKRGIGF